MIASPITKRVSFNEGSLFVIHPIELIDQDEVQDLFYQDEDYERFRYERQLEIERSRRKQLHDSGFARAQRRSSIELMGGSSMPTRAGPPRVVPEAVPPRRRQPRRTGHNGIGYGDTSPPIRAVYRASYNAGVAFAA